MIKDQNSNSNFEFWKSNGKKKKMRTFFYLNDSFSGEPFYLSHAGIFIRDGIGRWLRNGVFTSSTYPSPSSGVLLYRYGYSHTPSTHLFVIFTYFLLYVCGTVHNIVMFMFVILLHRAVRYMKLKYVSYDLSEILISCYYETKLSLLNQHICTTIRRVWPSQWEA